MLMYDTDNIAIQMRKGILEYLILLIISKGEVYASDIISGLQKYDLLIVEGTLYPLLTRLKNAEILSYRWEESTGGPPRKYYKLTEKGELFIAELDKTWNQLVESVTQITKNQ